MVPPPSSINLAAEYADDISAMLDDTNNGDELFDDELLNQAINGGRADT